MVFTLRKETNPYGIVLFKRGLALLRELGQLFLVFSRIGGLTFGGGYAMLPLMQKEIVENKKWATNEEMIDYYALAQSIPGIIAINTATFLGYDRRGPAGAVAATMGMVFPSLVIITLIASFVHVFETAPLLQHAFAGVRVAVTALIIWAVVRMWRSSITNWVGVALFTVSLAAIFLIHISPVIVIVAAAAIGVWQAQRAQTKTLKAENEAGSPTTASSRKVDHVHEVGAVR